MLRILTTSMIAVAMALWWVSRIDPLDYIQPFDDEAYSHEAVGTEQRSRTPLARSFRAALRPIAFLQTQNWRRK